MAALERVVESDPLARLLVDVAGEACGRFRDVHPEDELDRARREFLHAEVEVEPARAAERIDEVLDHDRLQQVLAYEEDCAGGLMNVDIVTVRPDVTLEVVARYLRARGEMPDGTPFAGPAEFKGYLMKRKDMFAKHLAERLLTYGSGRRVEALDRPAVDQIVKATKEDGYGLRTMIREVVVSDYFLSR